LSKVLIDRNVLKRYLYEITQSSSKRVKDYDKMAYSCRHLSDRITGVWMQDE